MLQKIKIIIAEDHQLFRQLLTESLHDYGIDVVGQAENGLQLFDLLETITPDLILLDIEMPKMGGSETFEKLRVLYPSLKIIFLSTHNQQLLVDYFYEKGASAYVCKNEDHTTLVEAIRMVHENKYVRVYNNIDNLHEEPTVKFTKSEAKVIPLVSQGLSNKEIADKLDVVNKTVEAHKKSLFKKTNTKNVAGLVNYIIKKGLNNLR